MQSLEEQPSCYIANRIHLYLLEWIIAKTKTKQNKQYLDSCFNSVEWISYGELVIQNLFGGDGVGIQKPGSQEKQEYQKLSFQIHSRS